MLMVKNMAILAYVLFKVVQEPKGMLLKNWEFAEVVQADIIFGEYDVIARVTIDDLEKLEEFFSQSIRNVSNVLVTSTMIISREYKGKSFRPKNK